MPLPLAYSRRVLIAAIIKDVTNDTFAPDSFPISEKEMCLYIDQAAAARMIGQVYAGAKIEGALVVPESYLITYTLPSPTQDPLTFEWKTTLPQPPVSLPLGYSVTRVFFGNPTFGISQDAVLIKSNRVGRRKNMPLQKNIRVWIENNTLWMMAYDGSPMDNVIPKVQMMSVRTTDLDTVMNMPEDDIQFVLDEVKKRVKARYGVPQDIIQDDLPAGNKAS